MLDQRRDLALRLFPGHEPRGATARPRERPQQGDWLVESWQAAGAVNIEPGQQPEQPVDGHVADLDGEAESSEQPADGRLAAAEIPGSQRPFLGQEPVRYTNDC